MPNGSEKKQVTSTSLNEKTRAALERIAQEKRWSVSQVLAIAADEYVQRRRRKRRVA